MEKIKLKNPIMLNGEPKDSFEYDLEQLEEKDILDAIANCHFGKEYFSGLPDNDNAFHLWIAFEAIMKRNEEVDVMDLKRVSGADCIKLAQIGCEFYKRNESGKEEVELEGKCYTINDNELTVEQYMDADMDSRRYANSIQKPSVVSAAGDMAFHLFVGYHILSVSDTDAKIENLRSMKGSNLIKIMKIGRNFILEALVEDYNQESLQGESEKSSEDIQESITVE